MSALLTVLILPIGSALSADNIVADGWAKHPQSDTESRLL